jgi:hypothetical protein
MPTRVFCPFNATTTGALNDGISSPRRIRSRLFSSPQRFTPPRGFTALSRAAYAHGISIDPSGRARLVVLVKLFPFDPCRHRKRQQRVFKEPLVSQRRVQTFDPRRRRSSVL